MSLELERVPELETVLPAGVVFASSPLGDYRDAYSGQELEAIEGAVPKRVREFLSGRHCARLALRELDRPPAAIPKSADGAPVWSDGVLGSIAHTDTKALAILACRSQYRSLGIDLEEPSRLTAEICEQVLRPEERTALGEEAEASLRSALIFCAKEAFYKLQHPLTKAWLGFEEASVVVENERTLRLRTDKPLLGQVDWSGQPFRLDGEVGVFFCAPAT